MTDISHTCKAILADSILAPSADLIKKLYSCLDLTNLSSNASQEHIKQLCLQAMSTKRDNTKIPAVAAVCVYPVYIEYCNKLLQHSPVGIATVTGCFPHAQTFAEVKFLETELAIKHGATEIDIVLNLSALYNKNESRIFDEIKTIKSLCGNKHLKVILETAIINDIKLIETAAFLAMDAGADFIKTSTGKDGSVASLEAVYIMSNCIKEFEKKCGKKIGLKPAGGISNTRQALEYASIVNFVLGESWLDKSLFRIGASRLASDLLNNLDNSVDVVED